ncbi:MAG: HAD family hydrolase [Alphaproteobacteria bacterium]
MTSAAFFDLDNTLTKQDSLLPWLSTLKGYFPVAKALFQAAITASAPSSPPDYRGGFKAALLEKILVGVSEKEAAEAGRKLASTIIWNPPLLEKLHQHRREGTKIIIITGALNVYVPTLLADVGYDDLISTEMEVQAGILTGKILGGNCVRAHKAERMKQYIAQHGPFPNSWGYGNRPHDEAMLKLVDNPVFV